jgi:hypothetical protein
MRFAGWADPGRQMRELFTRMAPNIAVSTDDHPRLQDTIRSCWGDVCDEGPVVGREILADYALWDEP